MGTWGSILVQDLERGEEFLLECGSDGFMTEMLRQILYLPHLLFEEQLRAEADFHKDRSNGFRFGFWRVKQMRNHLKRILEDEDPVRRHLHRDLSDPEEWLQDCNSTLILDLGSATQYMSLFFWQKPLKWWLSPKLTWGNDADHRWGGSPDITLSVDCRRMGYQTVEFAYPWWPDEPEESFLDFENFWEEVLETYQGIEAPTFDLDEESGIGRIRFSTTRAFAQLIYRDFFERDWPEGY